MRLITCLLHFFFNDAQDILESLQNSFHMDGGFGWTSIFCDMSTKCKTLFVADLCL